MDACERVVIGLRSIDGVVESASMFGPGAAFWCNGKEIAHFHAVDVLELRLTKAVIRELRAILRADERVELRKGTSDWIEVRISANADVAFALDLFERAAAAHRAQPGETPREPPSGEALERRRRFH